MRLHLPGHGDVSFIPDGLYATLAHHGDRTFVAGREYKINGTNYVVVTMGPSKYVPAVTVVTLREI